MKFDSNASSECLTFGANVTVGGVILAGGKSQRMGTQNKLLAEIDGVPIIRQTAQALLDGGLNDLVIVTGHEHN